MDRISIRGEVDRETAASLFQSFSVCVRWFSRSLSQSSLESGIVHWFLTNTINTNLRVENWDKNFFWLKVANYRRITICSRLLCSSRVRDRSSCLISGKYRHCWKFFSRFSGMNARGRFSPIEPDHNIGELHFRRLISSAHARLEGPPNFRRATRAGRTLAQFSSLQL